METSNTIVGSLWGTKKDMVESLLACFSSLSAADLQALLAATSLIATPPPRPSLS
jgi:hypothetical protein